MKNPPKVIYYGASSYHSKIYANVGHLKNALNYRSFQKIYRLVLEPNGPDVASFAAWEDVTEEFE